MAGTWNDFLDTVTQHVAGVLNANDDSMAFFTGEVISISPLKIKINEQFILDERSLLLSATVKETWINIPAPTSTEPSGGEDDVFQHRHYIDAETELANDGQGADHKHAIKIYTEFALPKIRLWRGLKVGDVVRLLKLQGGQFYFVLEREETITNETVQEEEDA